jgi:hypothetical protein
LVSAPRAPDPVATAQAQGGMNRDTAISQQLINMTDQVNPWGSVSYSPNGSTSYVDSTGRTVSIPRYTQTTNLSPEQQEIFNRTQTAQTNLSGLAADQSGMLRDYLSTPFEFDNQDAADWSYDLASSRILPQQQRNEEALRTRLINQGIRPGSSAFSTEMNSMGQQNVDQLNQLALTGRSQAFGESIAQRNQPINEITALMSGSQVSNPAQMSGATPQASVGGVDYTGLVNQQYQGKLASHNAMMGGLFGLAGAAVPFLSDERAKKDITRVGTLDNGLPVYLYRYKSGGGFHIGLMAQDVEKVRPEAVTEIEGMKAVYYDRAVA